jgi:hypothetical protein
MLKITTPMPLWVNLFFIISTAIASGRDVSPGQNVDRLPNEQVLATQRNIANYDAQLHVGVDNGEQITIKEGFLNSKMLQAGYSAGFEQVTTDLPRLQLGKWNETHMHLDRHTGTPSLSNMSRKSHLEMVDSWHHRKIDYHEFVTIEVLQHDRLQIVTHPAFDAPVLIKIASFQWEIASLQREAIVYRLLHGSRATPKFLGHVVNGSQVIGFIIEYIEEVPSIRGRNMANCLVALRSLHERGIAHGDAHDGNCLIRKDGSAVFIDFELSLETWSHEEFERDFDIIGRCIQELSEHP